VTIFKLEKQTRIITKKILFLGENNKKLPRIRKRERHPKTQYSLLTTMSVAKKLCCGVPTNTRHALVMCGPSGVGKSTLLNKLLSEFPSEVAFCTSHTTRAPRPGEQNGKEYFFVSPEFMHHEKGEFLEMTTFAGNMYGTSQSAVKSVLDSGRICLLDLDLQGVKSFASLQDKVGCKALNLFVGPPNIAELENRLRFRGESEESICTRMKEGTMLLDKIRHSALEGGKELFDHYVVNDNLEETYEDLKRILQHAGYLI
jgi:guanylate kinase